LTGGRDTCARTANGETHNVAANDFKRRRLVSFMPGIPLKKRAGLAHENHAAIAVESRPVYRSGECSRPLKE